MILSQNWFSQWNNGTVQSNIPHTSWNENKHPLFFQLQVIDIYNIKLSQGMQIYLAVLHSHQRSKIALDMILHLSVLCRVIMLFMIHVLLLMQQGINKGKPLVSWKFEGFHSLRKFVPSIFFFFGKYGMIRIL